MERDGFLYNTVKPAFIVAVVTVLVALTGCSDMMNAGKNWGDMLFFSKGSNSFTPRNAVGPTRSNALRTLDVTPTDSNTIFISKTGNDTTGNGTQSAPFMTITKAITACDADHQTIIILDSNTYEEKGFEFAGNFRNLAATLGQTPVVRTLINGSYMKEGITVVDGAVFCSNAAIGQIRMDKFKNADSFVVVYSIGDGRFIIVNDNGSIIVAEKVFETDFVEHKSVCTLSNDNFFISWNNQFVIYDSTGGVVKEKTSFTASGVRNESIALSNDNVVLAVRDGAGILKYKIFDNEGNEVVSEITVSEKSIDGMNLFSLSRLSNDNFIFSYFSSTKGYFKIYDNSGNVVVPETEFDSLSSGSGISTRMDVFADDYFVIVYTTSDNTASFSIWSPDGDNVVSKSIVTNGTTAGAQFDVKAMDMDMFVVAIRRSSDGGGVYYVYERDGTPVLENVVFRNEAVSGINTEITQNGNALIAYRNPNSGRLTEKNLFHGPAIKISAESAVNGILFDAGSCHAFDSIFDCAAAFSMQWCDMTGFLINPDTFNGYVLYSDSSLTMRNSRVYGNSSGLYIASGAVTLSDTQLYRNESDYALHINGAAAMFGDITIGHCDFFDNSGGGLRLEGNNGNEVIKNSIFHGNTGFAVSADTAVTAAHSVITDAVSNVISGDGLFTSDPLYVNEGVPGPEDIDLNIQTLFTGYPADSPALSLADDGRNAGAYDVEYP